MTWRSTFLTLCFFLIGWNAGPLLLAQEQSPDGATSEDVTISSFEKKVAAGIQYDTSYVEKKLRKRAQPLTVFGYYRFFGYGRNMTEPYPNLAPYERAYGVGDGYREPMLSMTIIGRPNGRTTFGSELFAFTPYTGGNVAEENVFSTNLGINFYGNFRTEHGNFGIRAGGIHWYNLSDMTIGVFQILDRFSIFDRTPWEGVSNTKKYDSYFKTGATSPGDLRWNNQAFQGMILNGGKLPGNFNFDLFWGKTQPNGGLPNGLTDPYENLSPLPDYGDVPDYFGFAGDARTVPNFITGGKIGRSFGKHNLSYNMIHSQTALDSVRVVSPDGKEFAVPDRSFQVHSLAYDLKFDKVQLKGELGAGAYQSPTYDQKWGEALVLRAFLDEDLTGIPIDVQLYQVNKNFFNPNGAIATNSNPEILKDLGIPAGANGVGGQLPLVNQIIHNRRGLDINAVYEYKDVAKFTLGWGLSQEIDPEATQLSFVHRINGLALSRIYNPFPANATGPTVFGPYTRKLSFFRGVSEVVPTTDLNPADATALNQKYFNAIDLQAKFKATPGDKPLYLFYLGSFGSAKSAAAPLPSLNDDTYLYVQSHEVDVYYELFPRFIVTGYLGLEYAQGGRATLWNDETQLPLNQFGQAIGLGFDWQVSESTGIYFRQRWMEFEDKSYSLDTFKGREATIELKTFF